MSERQYADDEPFARAGELEFTRNNTSLYRHIGKWAMYDNIFIKMEEQSGAFMWGEHENFEEVATLMGRLGCEMHLNIRHPSEGDMQVYERNVLEQEQDFDTLPENWGV